MRNGRDSGRYLTPIIAGYQPRKRVNPVYPRESRETHTRGGGVCHVSHSSLGVILGLLAKGKDKDDKSGSAKNGMA